MPESKAGAEPTAIALKARQRADRQIVPTARARLPSRHDDAYPKGSRPVAFNFAPNGWALCNGQLLSISQNVALFSLLGTTYGGDGVTTFALPDLRGRVPIHAGTGSGLPARDLASSGGSASSSTVKLVGKQRDYAPGEVDTLAGFSARAVSAGGQTDDNMPPFLTLNYIIALQGIFPSP